MSQQYAPSDRFSDRHNGPNNRTIPEMLNEIGCDSLEALIDEAVPGDIRLNRDLELPEAHTEHEAMHALQMLAEKNQVWRSYIGMGFNACITPKVILRNVIENPQWYTPYTPYQAEVAQGRLEVLLNFQTMITELTGMAMANASLLDESTAAAEAVTLCHRTLKRNDSRNTVVVDINCHPQTIDVVKTRALPLGLHVIVADHSSIEFDTDTYAVLIQYPDTHGSVNDYTDFCEKAREANVRVIVAADLLSLLVLTPPGDFGADIVVGNTQRFGMPMGFGGPHAAFLAVKEEFQRQLPGRIVGISTDAYGNPAFRLSLQTREQHIRRDKATSNICTAQALPAMVAAFYATFHGPDRLRQIAMNTHLKAAALHEVLVELGYKGHHAQYFDTIRVSGGPLSAEQVRSNAENKQINLRYLDDQSIVVSLDETVSQQDLADLVSIFGGSSIPDPTTLNLNTAVRPAGYLQQAVFNRYHSETELMRYMDILQSRDIGLNNSMIPLGSCTMKLNAAAEMTPVTWPGFAHIHPFAPSDQCAGYAELTGNLESWLAEITGFHSVSLQPNAGSQGEYAGLLAIRAYHLDRGDEQRTICLIPKSAHGTNPASAVMVGMKVVAVECDENGNIDVADLRTKAETHRENLGALMITYPSTHGVFETTIREICQIIHEFGGQVYLDGANMNAMVGLCRPGDFGADVCHLNLHKTFCIPHGGGGPGMGPIGVVEHLAPFLPGHPHTMPDQSVGAISAAPFGSGTILPISYTYILMMGPEGLKRATQLAILNANYIAKRLEKHFPVLYKGMNDRVAHECIIDSRPLKSSANVDVDDIAKRLMDYGFHAPTMSWPVAGTLMIEPTESESKQEIDRFCDAMIQIRKEAAEVENGTADPDNNVLKNAPHTQAIVISDQWDRPYTREAAAFPADWTRYHKYWPHVSRIDNVTGDRNLVCTCDSVEAYM